MLLLGGNRISIHSLYPFHLHRGLDRGAFWIQSHSHTQTIYYGQAGVSERGQGTGALVHDFVDTMNSRSEKAISYDTSPPKLPPSEFPTRLNELLSGRVQTEVHKRKFWIESSGKIQKFAYAINEKKIYSCVRFNRNSCLTAKADNAALYLRGDKNTNWFTWYGGN